MYQQFIYNTPEVKEVATDILAVEFWKPEFCQMVITAAENLGTFQPSPDDPVPGAEMRINKISEEFYLSFCRHWQLTLTPILENYYQLPSEQWFLGWKLPFIIKYSIDGQKSLRKHFDDSLISGSIKLNDNYKGAELLFPRQNFSNKDIPVGWILLWPSGLQHLHYTTEITSGVKYSLTAWTKQNTKESGINVKDLENLK